MTGVRRRAGINSSARRGGALLCVGLLASFVAGCGGSSEEVEPRAATDGVVQIMPIGDSITEGPFYRPVLLRSLSDRDCAIDFVGGRTGVSTLDPANPDHGIGGLDLDHQAIGGASSTDIGAALTEAVPNFRPDVAMIYAGTNDVFLDVDRDTTIANLRQMIGDLRAANPEVTILIAELMPIAAAEQRTAALNERIARLASGLSRTGSPIITVDMFSDVDPVADLTDGVHPTDGQSETMTGRWLGALEPALDALCRSTTS